MGLWGIGLRWFRVRGLGRTQGIKMYKCIGGLGFRYKALRRPRVAHKLYYAMLDGTKESK